LEDPPDVGGEDEVPCRPEEVSSKDRLIRERLVHRLGVDAGGTLRHRPFGQGELLRLKGPQPVDDIFEFLEWRSPQVLPVHAPPGDLPGIHGVRV